MSNVIVPTNYISCPSRTEFIIDAKGHRLYLPSNNIYDVQEWYNQTNLDYVTDNPRRGIAPSEHMWYYFDSLLRVNAQDRDSFMYELMCYPYHPSANVIEALNITEQFISVPPKDTDNSILNNKRKVAYENLYRYLNDRGWTETIIPMVQGRWDKLCPRIIYFILTRGAFPPLSKEHINLYWTEESNLEQLVIRKSLGKLYIFPVDDPYTYTQLNNSVYEKYRVYIESVLSSSQMDLVDTFNPDWIYFADEYIKLIESKPKPLSKVMASVDNLISKMYHLTDNQLLELAKQSNRKLPMLTYSFIYNYSGYISRTDWVSDCINIILFRQAGIPLPNSDER